MRGKGIQQKRKYILTFRQKDKDIFDAIRTGKKKIETRAATKRYQAIRSGDMLVFKWGSEKFEKETKKVTVFKTITAMLKKYRIKDIMPSCKNAAQMQEIYFKFPGYKEKIKKSGLIAFELK